MRSAIEDAEMIGKRTETTIRAVVMREGEGPDACESILRSLV